MARVLAIIALLAGCSSSSNEALPPDPGALPVDAAPDLVAPDVAAPDVAAPDVVSPELTAPSGADTDAGDGLASLCEVNACPFAGATACDDLDLLTCVESSGCFDWAPPASCDDGDPCTEDGCAGGACTHVYVPGCPASCPEGGKRCDPVHPDAIETCTPGEGWTPTGVTCPYGCTDGVCNEAKCTSGEQVCLDAGTVGVCSEPAVGLVVHSTCPEGSTICVAGKCVGVLAWTAGDTEDDAKLWLVIHSAGCSLMPAGLCFVLDTVKLGAPLALADLQPFVCSGSLTETDLLGIDGHTEAEVLAAAKLVFGCDGPATFEGTIQTGHPLGVDCQVHEVDGKVGIVPCASVPGCSTS